MKKIISSCNSSLSNEFRFCSACAQGKTHKLPYSHNDTIITTPLAVIHSDLWGPSPIVSRNGYRYYVSFIDAFSRCTWIYFLKQKSEVYEVFTKFKTKVELQFSEKNKACPV